MRGPGPYEPAALPRPKATDVLEPDPLQEGASEAALEPGMSPPPRWSKRLYLLSLVALGAFILATWNGSLRFSPVVPGERAPTFEAHALDGTPARLADYRGKVVLLNIWATWCAPCRHEMPSMEALYREFSGADFEILAVSVDVLPPLRGNDAPAGTSDRDLSALSEFADELDLSFPILHDPSGRIQSRYQTTGVPESFIIDREGRIVRRVPGATVWDHESYRELIRQLLET